MLCLQKMIADFTRGVEARSALRSALGKVPFLLLVAAALFGLMIAPAQAAPTLNCTTPPSTVSVGNFVSMNCTASGGSGTYGSWTVSGNYPPGMSYNSFGVTNNELIFSGTASIAGTYTFTVTVTDSSSAQGSSGPFTITVGSGGTSSGIITLSSVSPTSLTVNTPYILTLQGTNFTTNTIVYFNGTAIAPSFQNSNLLYASIPAYLVTSGNITVYVRDPVNGTSGNFTVTGSGSSNGSLSLASIIPNSAPVGSPGVAVTLNGSGFSPGAFLSFGTVCPSISTSYVSSSMVTATIPANCLTTAGIYNVSVGASNTVSFTVGGSSSSGIISFTSYYPTMLAAGATTNLTLYGANFTPNTRVYVNGTLVSSTYQTSTSLIATIPGTLVAGSSVSVYLIDPTNGQSSPLSIAVSGSTQSGSITLSGSYPTTITSGTAFTLQLYGSNFTANTQAYINGSPVTTAYQNSTSYIIASVPASVVTGASLAVYVRDPTTGTSNTISVAVTGSSSTGVSISSLVPSSIPAGSASFVLTLYGSGFVSGALVTFGSTSLSGTLVNSGEIQVTVPAQYVATAGTINVSVGSSNVQQFTVTGSGTSTLSVTCSPTSGPSTINVAYTQTCTATGGTSPYTWSVTGLPTGLTETSIGSTTVTISGTPSVAQTYSYTVQAVDSSSSRLTGSTTISGTVGSGSSSGYNITSLSPSTVTAGSANFTLTVNGNGFTSASQVYFNNTLLTTSYVTATQLTALVPSSLLTTAQNVNVYVSTSGVSTNSLTETISSAGTTNSGNLTILCSPGVGPQTQGTAYLTTCTASGGTPPYTWPAPTGLPSYLTVSGTSGSTITISGTPAATGPYNFTVKVTDNSSPALVNTLQLAGEVVTNNSSTGGIVLTSISPTSAPVNSAPVILTLIGSGFTNTSQVVFSGFPITTTYVSGSQLTATIPSGLLTYASAALVTVSTPGVGTSNGLSFIVGSNVANPVSILCSPGVGPSAPNTYYASTCSANGGTGPYTWSIGSGTLPTGLTLSPAGLTASIAGFTTQSGPYSYTLQIADSSSPPNVGTLTFAGTTGSTTTVTGLTLTSISPTSIAPGAPTTTLTINGANFASTAVAYFNSTPLSTTFVNAGQLNATIPANLLGSAISASITVQSNGQTSNPLTLTVGSGASSAITISCNPAVGPSGTGVIYSSTCTASGGKAPFTWTTTPSPLPLYGVVLGNSTSSSVTISGTTFYTGQYAYTLQVTDSSTPAQTANYPFAGILPTGQGGVFSGTVTNINPISAPINSSALTLTVTGAGFINGQSFVLFGNTPLTTSFISATQLSAVVPAYLLTTPGTVMVQVETSGYGNTDSVGFFVNGSSGVAATPASIAFTYAQGGTIPTTSVSLVANTSTTGTVPGFNLSVSATYNNITWLSVTPTTGTFPATLTVTASPAGLPIGGPYNGTITVTGYGGIGTVTIPVSLTVTGAISMVAAPNTLTFTTPTGTTATTQTIKVTASDGQTPLAFNATAVANNGGNWLSVTPSSGTTPATLTVTAAAGTLPANSYLGQINVTPTSGIAPLAIPVTFNVVTPVTLTTSPASLSFNGVIGQSNPAVQTINITANGSTAANFSVAAATASGGNWLSVSPTSGSTPGSVSVSVNTSSLTAGNYSGTLTISAPNATQVTINVSLTVSAAAATLAVSPTTLTFNATAGGSAPAAQNVNVTTTNSTTANYTVTASSTGNWLSATASGTTPGTISVTATPGTLTTGQYTGTLTISSPGATNTPQTVQVTMNVVGPPSITVAPQSLSFFVPGDGSTPAPKTITVISTGGGTNFTASAFSQGGNWLSASGSGTTPGSVVVSVNPAGLTPGLTYNGTVTISAPASNPSSVQVAVSLTLAQQGAVPLQASPSALYLYYDQGAGTDLQHVLMINNGGGTVTYQVTGQSPTCGNWLSVATPTGAASASTPGIVGVFVNPAGLTTQTCRGSIAVADSNGNTATVPVYMAVSGGTQSILLSQTAMNFVAAANGSPAGQTFQVLNPGSGSMAYSISTSTLSGGSWLSASPNSGNAASLAQPGSPITVNVNPQGLAAGTYYGTVQVAASGANNGPQSITVSLIVTSGSAAAQVSPYGVILTGVNGSASSQTVNVTNPGSAALSYSAIVTTDDGQSWLSATPTSGSIPAGSTNAITVGASINGVGTGLRHGTLVLAFSDGTVQTVDVQLAIAGTSSGTAVAACGASNLALEFLSPQQNFQAAAQVAVPVKVLVQDCGGNQLTSSNTGADVIANAGNSDIRLNYIGNGVWAGTWTPSVASSAGSLTALAVEIAGGSVATGSITVNGSVGAAGSNAPPQVSAVVNAGSFLLPGLVAPGTMVSIFGASLADGQSQVNSTPFPTSLQGAQFKVRGVAMPLFYASSGQVNAVLPIGLTPDERDQVIVVRDTTQSAPVDLLVADADPGIFAVNSQGTGQGAILVGGTAQIAAPSGSIPGANAAPASAGQAVSLFVAGLGAVSNPPADGSPSTGNSLTNATPTVTIGGLPAQVAYSGLAPGEVGLYQVNVVVPAGVPTGSAVPVVITMSNGISNTVTMAIQ